jgi:hypothetical protein
LDAHQQLLKANHLVASAQVALWEAERKAGVWGSRT